MQRIGIKYSNFSKCIFKMVQIRIIFSKTQNKELGPFSLLIKMIQYPDHFESSFLLFAVAFSLIKLEENFPKNQRFCGKKWRLVSLLTEMSDSCVLWPVVSLVRKKNCIETSLPYLPHNDYLLLIGLLSWLEDKILSSPLVPWMLDYTYSCMHSYIHMYTPMLYHGRQCVLLYRRG